MKKEKEEDRRSFLQLTHTSPVAERRENGMTWFPIAIKDTELGRGDYLTVEAERTTHQDILHQFRFGMSAALFSNHDPKNDRVEGIITHISGCTLEVWTTVLLVAVNHRKREARSSEAIGPPALSPLQIRSIL